MRVCEHFLCDKIIGLHELCIPIKILTVKLKRKNSEMEKREQRNGAEQGRASSNERDCPQCGAALQGCVAELRCAAPPLPLMDTCLK